MTIFRCKFFHIVTIAFKDFFCYRDFITFHRLPLKKDLIDLKVHSKLNLKRLFLFKNVKTTLNQQFITFIKWKSRKSTEKLLNIISNCHHSTQKTSIYKSHNVFTQKNMTQILITCKSLYKPQTRHFCQQKLFYTREEALSNRKNPLKRHNYP